MAGTTVRWPVSRVASRAGSHVAGPRGHSRPHAAGRPPALEPGGDVPGPVLAALALVRAWGALLAAGWSVPWPRIASLHVIHWFPTIRRNSGVASLLDLLRQASAGHAQNALMSWRPSLG